MSEVSNQIVNYPTIPAGGDAGQNLMKKSSADFDADFDLPVLFDETGTERVVGWYKYANGTKKPVYLKLINFTIANGEVRTSIKSNFPDIGDFAKIKEAYFTYTHEGKFNVWNLNAQSGGGYVASCSLERTDNDFLLNVYTNHPVWVGASGVAVIYYTKSTDTPT